MPLTAGLVVLMTAEKKTLEFDRDRKDIKVLLASYFLLMYVGIDVFFIIINFFNPNGNNIPIVVGLVISAGCYALLRRGWRTAAIVIQLIRTNYIAFFFTIYDVDQTGNFFYFIVSGIGALALFGYEERWKGIVFSGISLLLFYVSVLDTEHFTPASGNFFLVMNFTIAYVMAFVMIFFLNQLTYFSQQKAREKNQELEKVNSELDRFVYSVSHDLRAPLSSISGLIQLTEKSAGREETHQYLQLMRGRIERLEQFIRDIINFSRNARSETRLEKVNVREMIDDIAETLQFVNGADKIDVQDRLPEFLEVMTDKTRLQIVLFNLMSNAIQYKDPFKEDPYIRFSSESTDTSWKLLVDDNGIGIDQVHQAKVFNMFYRASENSKGSGLGLYIVKETVERLGGTISLHSVLGEGTRFTLEFPVQPHLMAELTVA